jgi:hypothetical protein
MKRVFSLLFAVLILLSGMHLTVASHLCGGELAAVKWSLTGKKASCGMQESQLPVSGNGAIESDCCKNRIASCESDGNYFSPSREIKEPLSVKAPAYVAVLSNSNTSIVLIKTYHSMVGPPVTSLCNTVEQSVICVFII